MTRFAQVKQAFGTARDVLKGAAQKLVDSTLQHPQPLEDEDPKVYRLRVNMYMDEFIKGSFFHNKKVGTSLFLGYKWWREL